MKAVSARAALVVCRLARVDIDVNHCESSSVSHIHTHTHTLSLSLSLSLSIRKREEKLQDYKEKDRILFSLLWLAACCPSASIPGSACAIRLKSAFTLWPSLALVSMNMRLCSRASSSPCAVVTSRRSLRSVLLPTRTMMTSLPRSPRTSSTHLRVFSNDLMPGLMGDSPPAG